MSAVVLTAGLGAVPGCLDRPIEPVEPRTTTTIVEKLTQSSVDKIDLLLTVDNSRSMADKQEILKAAVPDLVQALVNPRCVDENGAPAAQQPTDPLQDCPIDGTKREFEPVLDIHIGIITSAIGGHGADACDAVSIPSEDDKAHLITRSGTDQGDPVVPTWENKGFLVWDPSTVAPSHNPQGETDVATLVNNLKSMVGGAGEVGCGFEASLEAWYRFLVEPDPHESITLEKNSAVLQGTDSILLQQRADFMRPDSLLAVIMLSDENDCSIRDGGQFYFAAQIYSPGTNQPYHLPKPRAACKTDPNSPCCRSCGQSPGSGCDDSQDDCSGQLSSEDDSINLRCFDQKRRFGIDFLWPIDRYTTGLTSSAVQDRHGNVVPNPVFSDLNPNDENTNIRDPGLVFIAGIIGVPWQDIARKNAGPDGEAKTADDYPDLLGGLDIDGNAFGGFQSGAELVANGTWDIILGDPANYVPPTDPLMIESVDPRSGTNPVTGDAIQPPSAGELANPINGHEYSIPNRSDLQYACIFPLGTPRDCTDPNQVACDCSQADNDNPLCDPMNKTSQKYAKAYPGIRELQVLKKVANQGIVASICPEQQNETALFNYGYRPAIGAIIERLKQALGGQCLPRSLTPNYEGQVACLILEASHAQPCACTGNGRKAVDPQFEPAVKAAQQQGDWDCFCEIEQTRNDPNEAQRNNLEACQNTLAEPVVNKLTEAVHGWCYIDATTVPPTGNQQLVDSCPSTEKRIIRFVGDGHGSAGATLFITCAGE